VKFIVDAQLPKSLSDFLCGKGYDSIHTFDLPNKNKTTDTQIISISITENRIVISKDNDFLESLLLTGQPKKLIFVKTGNIQNADLISIFDSQIVMISTLLIDNSLVEITKTEIVVHV
jgi:predicted nuclease of predicted toxin-antitoxin system